MNHLTAKSSFCNKRPSRREAGLSKWTVLVFGLLTVSVLFVAYHVLPFYYYYYELLNQINSLAEVASSNTDQEIRNKLYYHIKKMKIPVEKDEISIARYDNRIQISVEYDEVFYITFRDKDYDIHTFHFQAYVDRNY
ncbi:MAG: DUF4845 domain-containing protein [Bdellovibrionales bacterium]|nr:DUF4845 domain-containing protein [Bdellovibrionales bacterium]